MCTGDFRAIFKNERALDMGRDLCISTVHVLFRGHRQSGVPLADLTVSSPQLRPSLNPVSDKAGPREASEEMLPRQCPNQKCLSVSCMAHPS